VKSYSEKMAQLKAEFSELDKKRRGKYKFRDYQQAVYDYVMGKRPIIQFEAKGEQYFLKGFKDKHTGEDKGFRHIIVKHYSDGCTGCITARDILNIANVAKLGRELTDAEINEPGHKGFQHIANGVTLRLIFKNDGNGNWIISLFQKS